MSWICSPSHIDCMVHILGGVCANLKESVMDPPALRVMCRLTYKIVTKVITIYYKDGNQHTCLYDNGDWINVACA